MWVTFAVLEGKAWHCIGTTRRSAMRLPQEPHMMVYRGEYLSRTVGEHFGAELLNTRLRVLILWIKIRPRSSQVESALDAQHRCPQFLPESLFLIIQNCPLTSSQENNMSPMAWGWASYQAPMSSPAQHRTSLQKSWWLRWDLILSLKLVDTTGPKGPLTWCAGHDAGAGVQVRLESPSDLGLKSSAPGC